MLRLAIGKIQLYLWQSKKQVCPRFDPEPVVQVNDPFHIIDLRFMRGTISSTSE